MNDLNHILNCGNCDAFRAVDKSPLSQLTPDQVQALHSAFQDFQDEINTMLPVGVDDDFAVRSLLMHLPVHIAMEVTA
jgi:hypothetical protein